MMGMEIELRRLAREVADDVLGGPPFAVGDEVLHPSGRKVRIISGQYWGTDGLSNHWTWQEVLPGGQLGPVETGYGWAAAS